LQVAELDRPSVVRRLNDLAGEHMRVNRWTDNFRIFSLRGMIVGDLLWLPAIGFVFAILTGIVG